MYKKVLLLLLFWCINMSTVLAQDLFRKQDDSVNSVPVLFAVKSDLLQCVGVVPRLEPFTLVPNLIVEVYFAKHWSLQAGWSYSNWHALTGNKELFSLSLGDVEGRYWLKSDSQYKGFFVNAYIAWGEYDVQKNMSKTLQADTGNLWGAGVGVGWLYSFSRNWAFECQFKGGYRNACNKLYDLEDGHYYYNSSSKKNAFDAQLKVSIIYRFEIGKTKRTKL